MSEGKLEHLLSLVRQLKNALPFLIKLKMDERKRIYRKGEKQLAYIRKTFQFAKKNPQHVPSYINLSTLYRNLHVADQISVVLQDLSNVTRQIEDTRLALYQDAFDGARSLYMAYQNAAQNGIAETADIVEELKQYFPRTGKKSST